MISHSIEQQVNLYQPILGAEKRLFSARAIGIALSVLAVCLVGLSAYGSRRIDRIEHSVDAIERREAANIDLADRVGRAVRPLESKAQLEAAAKDLSADIEARQRVLDIVRRDSDTPATGFAARLEALAQRQLNGVWLRAIVVGSGEGRLGMRGAANDAALVPAYLTALASEPALMGVRFDKLTIRRASASDAPAQIVFEADGPGLAPEQEEHAK
jgi:hypothetical protein